MYGGTKYEAMSGYEKVEELNALIAEWREPGFVRVIPNRVIPCTTNRESTGISAMHMHYIANLIVQHGFTPRNHAVGSGHDLPILVREVTGRKVSPLGNESMDKWRATQTRRPGDYPPVQAWMGVTGEEFFCSLGNGHFFQALNLFGAEHGRKFDGNGEPTQERYSTTADPLLAAAVEVGVEALVLGRGMPKSARRFVTTMLNSTFEFRWRVAADGTVRVDPSTEFRKFTSFDGLVKHADSFQLDEIIEMRLRHEQKRRQGKSSIYTTDVRVRDFGNQPGDYPGKQREQTAKEQRNNARM